MWFRGTNTITGLDTPFLLALSSTFTGSLPEATTLFSWKDLRATYLPLYLLLETSVWHCIIGFLFWVLKWNFRLWIQFCFSTIPSTKVCHSIVFVHYMMNEYWLYQHYSFNVNLFLCFIIIRSHYNTKSLISSSINIIIFFHKGLQNFKLLN